MIYDLDKCGIVLYNPWLLLKYQCHINVEACIGNGMVKYIYKYIIKGDGVAEKNVNARVNANPAANIDIDIYRKFL